MKVTIITTFYNSVSLGDFVHKAMNCLLNQTYKNIEFICVNDGSQDETLQQLKSYAESDNRIIIVDKENEGVAQYAKAAGQDVATGNFIMLFDHDDFLSFDAVEKAVDIINLNPHLEGISMQVETYYNDGKLRCKHNLFINNNQTDNFIYKEVSGVDFFKKTVGKYDIHFRGFIKKEKFKNYSYRYKERLVNGDEIVERLIFRELTFVGSCEGVYKHYIYNNSSAKSYSIKKTDLSRTDVILRDLFKKFEVYEQRKDLFELNTYKTFLNSYKIFHNLKNNLNREEYLFYYNRLKEAYENLDKKLILQHYSGLNKTYHKVILNSFIFLKIIIKIKA